MTTMAKRISANAKAMMSSTKFIAYTIIAVVVLYCDVMFVSLMWDALPGGFLRIFAVLGAFATGLSVIALIIGKALWFRPGGQLIWSWCFSALEIAISIMNVVVSVIVARGGHLDGVLGMWLEFAPATPVVALVGWILILYLDPERKQRHENMEMEDEQTEATREYKRRVHEAHMDVKLTALDQTVEYLKQHLASQQNQAALSAGAAAMAKGIIAEVVQRPYMPDYSPPAALPTGRVVDEGPVYSPPATDKTDKSEPAAAAPAEEKKEEKKQPKGFFTPPVQAANGKPKKRLPKLHRRKGKLGKVALASEGSLGEKTPTK